MEIFLLPASEKKYQSTLPKKVRQSSHAFVEWMGVPRCYSLQRQVCDAAHPDPVASFLFKVHNLHHVQSPYRLVVRTSRCGRDNPGSTPGEDIFAMFHWKSQCWTDAHARASSHELKEHRFF